MACVFVISTYIGSGYPFVLWGSYTLPVIDHYTSHQINWL